MFTHDDRLPGAVRRLQIAATVLQVNRREQSQVAIVTVSDAATRMLDDARALMNDDHVAITLARKIVPGFCRMAIDATCVDMIRAKRLEAGDRHDDVDELLDAHPKLYARMALALFDDSNRTNDVLHRLNAFGAWAATAFTACNAGAHVGSAGQLEMVPRWCRSFSVLSVLYPGPGPRQEVSRGPHLSKSRLTKKKLADAGISTERMGDYVETVNLLPNLQLLAGTANIEKQDSLPDHWIGSNTVFPTEGKRKTYIEENDLDGLPLDLASFMDFYEQRKTRVRERLVEVLGVSIIPNDPA